MTDRLLSCLLVGSSRQSSGLVTGTHTLHLQRHRFHKHHRLSQGRTSHPRTGSLLVPRLGAWGQQRCPADGRASLVSASMNFFTLTFRALGRNHIASPVAMLCFN